MKQCCNTTKAKNTRQQLDMTVNHLGITFTFKVDSKSHAVLTL